MRQRRSTGGGPEPSPGAPPPDQARRVVHSGGSSVHKGRPKRTDTQRDQNQVTEGDIGPVEAQVRADIADLGPLHGIRRSHAQIAYALARCLDERSVAAPQAVARELSACLAGLAQTATGREVSRVDAIVHEIADELAPRRRAVAPAGP